MQKNFESRWNLTLIPHEPAFLSLLYHVWSVKSCGVLLYLGFVEPLLQVRLMSRFVSDPAA
jgi:hypothetical protein